MKSTIRTLLLVAITPLVNADYDVVTLTPENYDELTEGKTIFVRFFAPWCGHSRKMAPEWAKLAKDWEGDDVGLIADIDCTGASKPICDKNRVYNFPTLKYGDPAAHSLDEYGGPRSYDGMAEFAQEFLTPICNPTNLDETCDDEEKTLMEEYLNLSKEEIQQRIKEEKGKLKQLKKDYQAKIDKLQEDYQEMVDAKDQKIQEIENGDLKYMLAIQRARTKGIDGPVDDDGEASTKEEL
ncbi:disulfide-isomerase-like protein EhSep2 [Seminavis robusta]|uniref:Disulfide-isomerase-like protein EhSep2 n=1 Tax=Seminavis robusta TaxID=568900 RepID=A0A9N8EIL0_9STRA|nr:disulfide-isomerase-like protein EhSep2 [Seminavis robusta]|eukprot:Sro1159_g247590.1 disulfide-isomerase-like protein EhSep2 (239) ;mRNA; f:17051-18071